MLPRPLDRQTNVALHNVRAIYTHHTTVTTNRREINQYTFSQIRNIRRRRWVARSRGRASIAPRPASIRPDAVCR
jgi:hypothetical protein